jgi:hypothetical protein
LYELFADDQQHWFFTMEYVDGVDFLRAVEPARDSDSRPRSMPSHTTPLTPLLSPDELETVTFTTEVRGNLTRHVPARIPLPPRCDFDRLRAMLIQLAEGLLPLHAAGLLHCDMKPSNVLVDRDGRVVILDFGLVYELFANTERTAGGTIPYISPEQAAGGELTEAADWYSVGVMAYLALTGMLPHRGRTAQEILLAKQTVDPPSPRELQPEVPADLDAICMRLLERDPSLRLKGPELLANLGAGRRNQSSLKAFTAQPPGAGTFVGRKAELAQLEECWGKLRLGQPVVVELSGESGVGKSTLMRHFLEGLERRERPVVLSGRCYEQESVPFKAMDSVIDSLSRYLRRLPQLQVAALLPREAKRLTQLFPVLDRVEALRAAS